MSGVNFSSKNGSSTVTGYQRDTLTTAVTKNVLVTALCISINYINGTLVHTFRKHQIFNSNPRYILFIHLVINDLMQLVLSTLLFIISNAFQVISISFCLILLIITILTILNTSLNLASMAVERYISICFPLHYSQMCTVPRTVILICVILILTATPPISDLFIAIINDPISFFHGNIFCDPFLIFSHHSIYYKNCVFDGVYLSFVALTLLYTYCKIMLTARAASMGLASVTRARNTVLLHGVQLLLCLLAFVVPSLQAALISLFPSFSLEICYIFFLVVYIIPRFMSPVIYGFRDEKFRMYWTRYLACQSQSTIRVRPMLLKMNQ